MAGIGEKIKIFFKEVWTQAKKIDWPSRRETFIYTVIVITVTVLVALFLGGLDYVFMKIFMGKLLHIAV